MIIGPLFIVVRSEKYVHLSVISDSGDLKNLLTASDPKTKVILSKNRSTVKQSPYFCLASRSRMFGFSATKD
jgi:hypothetical protein